jgi:hypothetical protein
VTCDHAFVVDAHDRNDLVDVDLRLDSARAESCPAREDRVVIDPALVEQSRPDVCREAEMRGVVSVQMPDLSSGCLERELASAARVGCKYSIRRVRGRNFAG